MNTIPIPENAVGRVGMVAALKRVREADVGKLVALNEPVGFLTTSVGSDKPVFAWLALALGEPIECRGKPSRSIYVADRCLTPVGEMSLAEIESVTKAKADVDFKAALDDLYKIVQANGMTPEELDGFVEKAADQFAIGRALEVVPTPQVLREIGFWLENSEGECLRWAAPGKGTELGFHAGCVDLMGRWKIVGSCVLPRSWVWDERMLPAEAPRGQIVRTVLDIWRTAFKGAAVPDCLQLGVLYEQHQAEMRILNPGVPSLWVEAKVFRQILKWLRERHPDLLEGKDTVTLSFADRLLRLDTGGTAFGCPAGGHWALDCKVLLSEMLSVAPQLSRQPSIRLEQFAEHIEVNGRLVGILV